MINLGLNFEEIWNVSFIEKVFLYLKKQRNYKKLLKSELMRIRPDITITTLRREINFIIEINDGSRKIGEQHLSRSNYRKTDPRFTNICEKFFFGWWKNRVVSSLTKLDKLVVLTPDAASEWSEVKNIMMIPDPLPIKVESCSTRSSKRVITIGRYSYEKGYDLLLKVWSIVEKKLSDWQLDIFAMGDPTPYVKMIPSRTEGFGLVIVEAMSCGLPVVSFDCENGPRSIITNGEDGFLIPPFDVEMFANSLMRLMSDDDLRESMGEKGKQNSQRYDIDIVGQQWKQLFDELMQNNGV